MATYYTLIATTNDDVGSLRNRLDKDNKRGQLQRAIAFFKQILGGNKRAQVRTQISTAKATFSVACDLSDAVDGTDELLIGAVTLALEAAPANENQFDGGASDIAFAANLAAAINAHSVLSEFCTAVSDGIDTVTVTCDIPGAIGNQIAVSEVGNGFEITGGATRFANGASDELDEWSFGISL